MFRMHNDFLWCTQPPPSSLHWQCLILWPDLASLQWHHTSTKLCPSLHYQCFSDQTWPLFTNMTHPQNLAPPFIINVSLTRLGLSSPTHPQNLAPPFIINVWHFVQTWPLFTNTTHRQNLAPPFLPSLSMFDTLSKLGLSSPTLHTDKTLPWPDLASLHRHYTSTKPNPPFLHSLTMFDTLTRLGLSSLTLHIHKTLPWPDLASLHWQYTSTKPCPDQTWPLFTDNTHQQNLAPPFNP